MHIIKRIKYTDIFAYLTSITSSLLIAEFSDDTIWPFLGFFLFIVSLLFVFYSSILLSTRLYPSYKSIRSLAVSHFIMLLFGWILVYSILFINPWLAFVGIIFLVINLRYQQQIEHVYEPSDDPNEFTWLANDANAIQRIKMLFIFGLGLGMTFQFTIHMDLFVSFIFRLLIALFGILLLTIYYRYAYQRLKDFKTIAFSIVGVLAAIVYVQYDVVGISALLIGVLPTLFLERKLAGYVIDNRSL